jgi:hypothetical protein
LDRHSRGDNAAPDDDAAREAGEEESGIESEGTMRCGDHPLAEESGAD